MTSYEEMSRAVDLNTHVSTPGEFMLLRFIFARTHGCGREWAEIKLHHFTDGLWEDDGKPAATPLLISARTLHKHIASLESHGMIFVDRSRKVFRYSLNECWFLPDKFSACKAEAVSA